MRVNQFTTRLDKEYRTVVIKEKGINYTQDNEFKRPDNIDQLFRDVYQLDKRTEEFLYLVCLNASCKLIGIFELSHGTVDCAPVAIRELFVKSLILGAVGVILVHNHPGGSKKESHEDIEVTSKIKKASELLQIIFWDHVIIAGDTYISLKEKGYL